jgi:cytochrome c-type biogenesis protein CcmH/NrfG
VVIPAPATPAGASAPAVTGTAPGSGSAATAPAPPAAAAAPRAPDADALFQSVSERLKALQRLRDGGLITEQEFQEKRREILRQL